MSFAVWCWQIDVHARVSMLFRGGSNVWCQLPKNTYWPWSRTPGSYETYGLQRHFRAAVKSIRQNVPPA